jgi:pyruvate/2-oxoacid:ferredoxin oxidoreductase beta subunit
VYTHQFYQENVYQLDTTYDHTNRALALQKTLEWDFKKIPVGILYQETRTTYEEQLPQLSKTALVKQKNSARNLTPIFTHYS